MEIFENKPFHWGLRGDEDLWEELKGKLEDDEYSLSPENFRIKLLDHFNSIIKSGEKISDELIYFKNYSQNGMSGGHVSLPWWEDTGLPHLANEYQKFYELDHPENLIILQDILPLENLKKQGNVILLRHFHDNLNEMEKLGLIEEFQSFQSKPAFKKAKYLVSFLAEPNNKAKFFGIFKVEELLEKTELPRYSNLLAPFCKSQDFERDFYLKLTKDLRFSKYEGRVFIDWVVPRGWYNTYGEVKNKPVVKISPKNFLDEFPGIMEINISAFDLRTVIENPDSHSEWYQSLSKLQAIYLILDKKSGSQYVGSTYGKEGLWQRWRNYVKSNFTGGNIKLMELEKSNFNFHSDFCFSILEVLPINANQNDCIKAEILWKNKLGTKAFGLNLN